MFIDIDEYEKMMLLFCAALAPAYRISDGDNASRLHCLLPEVDNFPEVARQLTLHATDNFLYLYTIRRWGMF